MDLATIKTVKLDKNLIFTFDQFIFLYYNIRQNNILHFHQYSIRKILKTYISVRMEH